MSSWHNTTAGCFLAPDQRRQVLWVGSLEPHELRGKCAEMGWEVRPVVVHELAETAPRARAVVIQLDLDDPQCAQRARQIAAIGLDHGLAVILALSESFFPRFPGKDKWSRLHDVVTEIRSDDERIWFMHNQWD